MSGEQQSQATTDRGGGSRSFRILLALFVFSGASGLIYEIVWLRMLIRAFGVTVHAVTAVLAVFMGGLALGAFVGGRFAPRLRNMLRAYAVIEVLIGVSAIVSTLGMQQFPKIVRALGPMLGESGSGHLPVVLLCSTIVLLPTTFLAGATLPILSGLVSRSALNAGGRVGLLYAANTIGAVLGVVACGFFLLGTIGETLTVLGGVVANVLVGIGAWFLPLQLGTSAPAPAQAEQSASARDGGISVRGLMWVYALSGMCALGYQVVWSRLLILLLGSSVYGFSSMLAIYLIGVALGSAIMSRFTSRLRRPLAVLATLLVGMGVLAVVSLHTLTAMGSAQSDARFLYSRIWDFADLLKLPLYSLVVVFPVTLLSGAIFPVLVRICSGVRGKVSDTVGRLYGVNTVGAIVGSLVAGFLLLPLLGSLLTLMFFSALSVGLGGYILLANREPSGKAAPKYRLGAFASVLLFVVLTGFSFNDPMLAILTERLPEGSKVLVHKEGQAGTVTIVNQEGETVLYINGHHISSAGLLSKLFFSFVPAAYHPAPKRALAVGMGAGEACTGYKQLGLDTTVVELVPAVVEAYPIFQPRTAAFLDDPKFHVVHNDGLNFLLQTGQIFDIIVVDGSPPIFSSGTVNLYTREFVELARDHLSEDGIFALWIPIPCFESDFWMIARNFVDVFPRVMIWAHESHFGTLLLGTRGDGPLFEATTEVLAARVHKMKLPENYKPLLTRLIADYRYLPDADVRAYAAQFPAVTDDKPYTEFPVFRFWRGETYYKDSSEYLKNAVGAADRRH